MICKLQTIMLTMIHTKQPGRFAAAWACAKADRFHFMSFATDDVDLGSEHPAQAIWFKPLGSQGSFFPRFRLAREFS